MRPSTRFSQFRRRQAVRGKFARLANNWQTLQRRLADLLYDCLSEIEKDKPPKKPLSHGFRRDLSIVTNARPHKGRRYVLNLDIEDFFPAFNFGRVRGFFLKNNNFMLSEKVATILAQIACYQNSLPQGSPCSPIISDLIAHTLDVYLAQLARRYTCTYTRYADDLTFSTNRKNAFPRALADLPPNGFHPAAFSRPRRQLLRPSAR